MAASMMWLAWGGTDHASGFSNVTSNVTSLGYLDQSLRWGFDWLMKAHANDNELWVQVGDGNVDNNSWVNNPLGRIVSYDPQNYL
jgi:endoglucanase